eukprot:scaffold107390_cov59-Phaeocystis_antarctica.AAC.3
MDVDQWSHDSMERGGGSSVPDVELDQVVDHPEVERVEQHGREHHHKQQLDVRVRPERSLDPLGEAIELRVQRDDDEEGRDDLLAACDEAPHEHLREPRLPRRRVTIFA